MNSENESPEDTTHSLQDFSDTFNEVMDQLKNEQEKYWTGLSKEEQLKAFCAVARRIHQAELIDKGSYRHVLYGVFGFGSESYAQAQLAGYLDIHNSIFDIEHETRLLKAFCVKYNIEDADNKVINFLI